ncbi:MAG: phosphate signaling complex protein PhoU [Chthoniobacterales bacterium]
MPENENRHTLGSFDNALNALRSNVFMMASLTERGMNNAVRGLFERDDDLCNIAIADDEEIDLLEMQIDRDGVDIMLRFQPVAEDLRQVVSSMKISVNLERIADQSVTIARRARKLNQQPVISEIHFLDPMFSMALSMYSDALKAFADRNMELAKTIKPRDKELDVLNHDITDQFTDCIQNHPGAVREYMNLIFIARSIERIGDHATNIAEDAFYAITAEDIRHNQAASTAS